MFHVTPSGGTSFEAKARAALRQAIAVPMRGSSMQYVKTVTTVRAEVQTARADPHCRSVHQVSSPLPE